MIIRLLGLSSEINIKCDNAMLSHITNSLSMKFENDSLARETETLLKQRNLKTKHNDSEITILNISDYELSFI
jgi:hypothetical protein